MNKQNAQKQNQIHLRTAPALIILLICAALSIPSLSGCKRTKLPDGFLTVALRSDPLYLNPVLASEMSSQTVNSLIFNSLVKYNENLEIIPDLAENWETNEQGNIWIFHLRKDVKWHDGNQLTSRDVKFTFEKLFDKSTNTFNRGLFQIDGKNPSIETPDMYTVKFTLPRPFAPFISNIAQMGIIPEHLMSGRDINRDPFNSHPVGTGPFVFKEWKSSEKVYLKANDAYFRGKPRLKGVVFIIIPSSESRRIALMTNSVDISDITPEDLPLLEKGKNITIYRWDQFVYYYLGFDLTQQPFADKKVRQAINYAIDKNTIISAIFKNNAVRATGPIPKASSFYSGQIETYDINTDYAKQLLAESGWGKNKDGLLEKDGKKLEFETIYPSGNAPCEKAAVFIQAQLKSAGIKMNLKAMEFSALINNCYPGKFQAIILNWVENIDPDCYTEWHSSQMGDLGMNFMSYSDSKTDKLLEEGRLNTNTDRRKAIYGELQKQITDDSPYVFLWTPKGLAAINNRVKGNTVPGPAGILLSPEKIYIEHNNQ